MLVEACDLLAAGTNLRTAILRNERFWKIAPGLAVVTGIAAVVLLNKYPPVLAMTPSLSHLIPYLGLASLIAAATGLAVLLLPRTTTREP